MPLKEVRIKELKQQQTDWYNKTHLTSETKNKGKHEAYTKVNYPKNSVKILVIQHQKKYPNALMQEAVPQSWSNIKVQKYQGQSFKTMSVASGTSYL